MRLFRTISAAVLAIGLCAGFSPNNIPVYEDGTGGRVVDSGVNINSLIPNIASAGLLATPNNLYVTANGLDTADCQAATVANGHGPCLTIQHAINIASLYNLGGVATNINIGPGTFGPALFAGPYIGGASGNLAFTDGAALTLKGAGASQTTISADGTHGCGSFGHALQIGGGALALWNGITFTTSCAGGSDIFIQDFAQGQQSGNDVVYGAASAQQIHVEWNGMFQPVSGFSVSGNALSMFGLSQHGGAEIGSGIITCIGSPAYSSGTVVEQDGAEAEFLGTVFSGCGGVTGTRAVVQRGSVLNQFSNSSPTYIPGNADVVYDTGSSWSVINGTVASAGFIGNRTAPTDANTALKVSRNSSTTWAGFGTDNGLNTYVANDSAGSVTRQFEFFVSGQAGPSALGTATANTLCYNDTFDTGYHILSTCSSLRELKDDIRDLPLGLSDVMKLQPREFWSKPDQQEEIGLIAEEVHDTVPLLSTYLDGKLNGVDYMHLTALLTKAMQEQQQEIDALFAICGLLGIGMLVALFKRK